MTQALAAMQWAVGASLVLLSILTLPGWTRHGGRSRQLLALTMGLLGLVAVLSQVTTVTSFATPVINALLITMFMGAAFTLVLFRESLVPSRLLTALFGALAVAVTAVTITVTVVSPQSSDATHQLTGVVLGVDIALLLSWCALAGTSILQVWLASHGVPAVQRARLRSLTLGFTGIIAALVADAVAAGFSRSVEVQVVIEGVVLASLPLLWVAFSPPAWLRRLWRETEEVQYRLAINDLLLYSPDVATMCVRALEWPSRLLGGRGAMITLNDRVVAAEGLGEQGAQHLHSELVPLSGAMRRSLVTSLGPVAVAPLNSRAGNGYIAVIGGAFTPLFGAEELDRLDQYRVSITVALDRVHLVEGVRRNAKLLDLAYDAVFAWDVQTRQIQYWNRAAADLYGFTAEEAIGQDPQQLIQTEFPEPIDRILAALGREEHWEGELAQVTKDGRRLPISARWALQRDDHGSPSSAIEINRDISAEKRAAEELRRARDSAEQASNAKSEYLSRMSHELRTPLAAMLGFSDLLEMREPRDDQLQAIEAIQRAGSHLLSLVNDVLDIARIESGRETMSLAPVAVERIIGECIGLVSQAASENGVTISSEPSGSSVHYVRADRQRLVQVLLNLLSNAIKYGQPGGKVAVTAVEVDGEMEIRVTDDGAGLDEQEQARLFQPFERLGAERSHVQGTGLGLALCRQLTAAMGGAIGVRSTRGCGAEFWIRLRKATPTDAAAVVPAVGPTMLSGSATGQTVLYVEDNLATIGLVESIFALRPNIRLITAMQGSLAVELAREQHPDVIILDLHLPDLNGDEVMRRLQDEPRTAEIPVVIYSADATHKQVERLLAEGAVAYLTKPARVAEFLGTLDRVIAKNVVRA